MFTVGLGAMVAPGVLVAAGVCVGMVSALLAQAVNKPKQSTEITSRIHVFFIRFASSGLIVPGET